MAVLAFIVLHARSDKKIKIGNFPVILNSIQDLYYNSTKLGNSMKKILLLIGTSILLSSCAISAKKGISSYEKNMMNGYVAGSEDIPLVKNLVQIYSSDLGFNSYSGSIAAKTYRSWEDLDKVRDFYIRTLPQMGWVMVFEDLEKFKLVRGNESLEIIFINENGYDLVKFLFSSTM